MKFSSFLKEKMTSILLFISLNIIVVLLLNIFDSSIYLTIMIVFILNLYYIIDFSSYYYKRKKYYDEFLNNLKKLDKKYLILETLREPDFLEGKVMVDSLYQINKSMMENIHQYKYETDDFKEYVEMWIHEIKIPISSMVLICHNNNCTDKRLVSQIKRLDNLTDQILYYVRSNYTEKDFLIKEVDLDKVINQSLLKNKDDILENNIDVLVNVGKIKVLTDSKWLLFILNQIINNSIKYVDKLKKSYISFIAEDTPDKVILKIKDNGIGVNKSDLKHVFEKSFTGENGRMDKNSTGFGLYICKKLIDRLGHVIKSTSIKGDYFEIEIEFGKNDLYKID